MNFEDLDAAEQSRRLVAFARHALSRWAGSFGEPVLVKYRENAVFTVSDSEGRRFALRVHRPDYHSDAALASELEWMCALARAGMRIPEAIPAKDGRLFVRLDHDQIPHERQVDVLTWLDGEQIGGIESGSRRSESELTAIYHEAGRLAAELHDRTERWVKPEGFQRHAWNEEGLIGRDPFWGPFLELEALTEAQRALLREAATRAASDLAAIGQDATVYGLIHADFVPENILVSDAGLTLIDFDDAGYGWYMFELATALFFHLDEPSYPAMQASLFAGYRSVRPRGVDEAQLPLFLLLRGITYLSWVFTRKETATAREMTPMFIERACLLAQAYLASRAALPAGPDH